MIDNNYERTGYRDLELSQKLRTIGYTVDVDGLFADFINFRAVSLSEYKHHNVSDVANLQKRGASRTIRNAANDLQIPYFIVIYRPGDNWQFNVMAGNSYALEFLGADFKDMSEMEFHQMHSTLRGLSENRSFSTEKGWIHPELESQYSFALADLRR